MTVSYQTNTLLCIQVIQRIIQYKKTLQESLEHLSPPASNRNLIFTISLGALRTYQLIDHWVRLQCKLKPKDNNLRLLLIITLYQVHFMEKKNAKAVIQNAVSCCDSLNRSWAKGLIKAVLEKSHRQAEQLTQTDNLTHSVPPWVQESLSKQYSTAETHAIYQTWLQDKPYLGIRANKPKLSADTITQQFDTLAIPHKTHPWWPSCTLIKRGDVKQAPGLSDSSLYVQDPINQIIASIVPPLADGAQVLDACGAPGGKAGALLYLQKGIHLTLVDKNPHKLDRTKQNLHHFQDRITILEGDSTHPQSFCPEMLYDCILLDTPCSATATIGQHPEIKLIRSPEDIQALLHTQRTLLQALWPYVKPEGYMLYSTCSILAEENQGQISSFAPQHNDLHICPLPHPKNGHMSHKGVSIKPDQFSHGGYYILLQKKAGKVCG